MEEYGHVPLESTPPESNGAGAVPPPGVSDADASSAVDSVAHEMRALGEKLSAALRAAAGTPEAQALKSDLREGMEGLRGEIDKALKRSPRESAADDPAATSPSSASQKLRSEAAGLLREANRALDRMATALQGPESSPDQPVDTEPGSAAS